MKKHSLTLALSLKLGFFGLLSSFSFNTHAQRISFEGTSHRVISVTPSKESGLDDVYVLYSLQGVSLDYSSTNPKEVRVSSFSNLGANYSNPVSDIHYGENNITLNNLTSDTGYIIEDGNQTKYIWIVDYSKYRFDISSISLSADNNCDATVLNVSGAADPIYYFTINGRRETISRDIKLTFDNLVFDESNNQFIEEKNTKNIDYIQEIITINPPILCPSIFTLSGDRFLKEWNQDKAVSSDLISPIATMVRTETIQHNNVSDDSSPSNQISTSTEGLGGSAPIDIEFLSYVSDAVIHCEWQMANDMDFEDITYRINQQDLNYTFTDEGTTYIRFIGSNADGSCMSYGDTYTVTIGASELLVPNAFSPNGDGVNDIWKVSYRSLLDFKCWIFDRQGHEIFSFNDPANGWDGRYKGKDVKPGVYFYVIQATGADGKKYKKSGDINILKSKNNSTSTNPEY